MKLLSAGISAALFISTCGVAQDGPRDILKDTHYGSCILKAPQQAAPQNPYYTSAINRDGAYAPFTKYLQVNGLTLAAGDEIPDDFILKVAKTTQEMFPQDPGLDLEKQVEVLTAHHRYNALIPMPLDGDYGPLEEKMGANDSALMRNNSICDIIMYGPSGQVTEVVEHILHYVNSVGLHYAFPDEWGISETSAMHKAMRKAIDAGYYDLSGYGGEPQNEEMFRVVMQEFGYWFITTAWNFQVPYGPDDGNEWTIRDRADLKAKMPEFFKVMENTVDRVMVVPSAETLASIGPKMNRRK